LNIGLAETFYWDFAGEIPLILKLNGKTDIPSDDGASPLTATVADAVRLGADAVGYTLHVGSPAQAADFAQYRRVREEATRFGMPLIAWACPRGSAFEASGGGANSFYAVDYAARVASELGADIVKVKFPHPEKRAGVPARYDDDFSRGRPWRPWCGPPTGRLSWSPAARWQARRRCSKRPGSHSKPAPPG